MSCDRESGDGACTPRSTVGECDTIARCGAGTFAGAVVVVDIADLERFVEICNGRVGESGEDAMGAAASSRLQNISISQ